MSTPIKVPSFGESVSKATVATILVKTGDIVAKDQELLELESDKVNAPVLAPESGKVSLTIQEGDELEVGSVIGEIEPSDEAPTTSQEEKSSPETATTTEAKPAPTAQPSANSARIDEQAFVKSLDEKPKQARREPAPTATPPKASAHIEVASDRKKMPSLRQTIAKRLVQVKNETAMLTTFNEVDMSEVINIRTKEKDAFLKKHGVKLGFMSFFVKACCSAMEAFPEVMAYIDGEELVQPHHSNISIAVSTEKGLFVPVLKECEELTFAEIEQGIVSLGEKAKQGKITMQDMQGGVFTITNGGVFGSLVSTPILNPPQSAILGMHAIKMRPVAIDGKVEIRPMMYLALSYDHRVIDGKEAVQFLVHVKDHLEQPTKLLLDF